MSNPTISRLIIPQTIMVYSTNIARFFLDGHEVFLSSTPISFTIFNILIFLLNLAGPSRLERENTVLETVVLPIETMGPAYISNWLLSLYDLCAFCRSYRTYF